jgi:membrane protein implicated in regulation of membrane protease activity
MRWLKVAAIAIGALVACLIISWVIGIAVKAAIAALVIAVIVLAVKVASGRPRISPKGPDGEIRGPGYRSRNLGQDTRGLSTRR